LVKSKSSSITSTLYNGTASRPIGLRHLSECLLRCGGGANIPRHAYAGDFFCDGELLEPPPYSVTGTWNLIIDLQTSAQLTLDVFIDGRHDVAFGYNALILISHVSGVYVFSAFGDFATATLDTSVTPVRFSWHVEFGISCPDQNLFNSLTFLGEANRGGG
jgi:hypothetical protein